MMSLTQVFNQEIRSVNGEPSKIHQLSADQIQKIFTQGMQKIVLEPNENSSIYHRIILYMICGMPSFGFLARSFLVCRNPT